MPDATGTALAPLTEEQRLRARILDLERERDEWKADAISYRDYWENVVTRCEREHVERIRELTAALARLGLRLP